MRPFELWPQHWTTRLLTLVAGVFLLKSAKFAIVPILVAALFALVLARPVHSLRRYGIPAQVAALLVLAGVLGGFAMLVVLVAPSARDWFLGITDHLYRLVDLLSNLQATLPGMADSASANGAAVESLKSRIASQSVDFTGGALLNATSLLLTGVATVILLYLLLISERWLVSQMLQVAVTRRKRAKLLSGLREVQGELYHLFSTMTLINAGLAVALVPVMSFIGVPNAIFLAFVAALLNFIPYFGPLISTLLFLLAGVGAFDSLPAMLVPPLAFIALAAFESSVVSPLVVGRRMRLHPLAILLCVILLGWLWGVIGAFLTVPLLVTLRCIAQKKDYPTVRNFLARHDETSYSFQSLLSTDERLRDERTMPPAEPGRSGEKDTTPSRCKEYK